MTVVTPQKAPVADVPKSSGTRLVDRVFKMRELAILLFLAIAVDRVVALRVASALKKRNARHG